MLVVSCKFGVRFLLLRSFADCARSVFRSLNEPVAIFLLIFSQVAPAVIFYAQQERLLDR